MEPADMRDLYERYGHIIYGRCMRILGDGHEAYDAAQDVFLKLCGQGHVLRARERIVPWIFVAAKRHCFNILRSRKKYLAVENIDDIAGSIDEEARMDARRILAFVLRHHGKKVRDAVYYSYVEKLSQDEIHALTGQSPATIRRCLRKFQRSVERRRQRIDA